MNIITKIYDWIYTNGDKLVGWLMLGLIVSLTLLDDNRILTVVFVSIAMWAGWTILKSFIIEGYKIEEKEKERSRKDD